VEGDGSTGVANTVRTGAIGTLVAGYALFDVIPIAVIVVGLTAWFERPLVLFAITAVALIVLNVACCRWLQRHWDTWIEGNGKRIEAKLDKMRKGRVMKHPVAWITRGSDWWYALATAIVNPIIVVVAARVVGGQPISERRIMIASVAYALPMAAVFTVTGYALGEALRAA
jgi:uncharacterized membrane protein (Fun14 family)